MSVTHDLMIRNGTYTDRSGKEKTRWKAIGISGTSAKGNPYMMIDPTVNLAAFEREPGQDMLFVSTFEKKAQTGSDRAALAAGNQPQTVGSDSEVPF